MPRFSFVLVSLVALAATALPGAAQLGPEAPRPGAGVRELTLRKTPGTRVEYFRLDRMPDSEDADGARRRAPVGVVQWMRGPLAPRSSGSSGSSGAAGPDGGAPRRAASAQGTPPTRAGWRTAYEVLLFEERTRVLSTERLTPELRELVFREVRDRSGRTVYLAWPPTGPITTTDTVGADIFRREIQLDGDAALPLSAVELARRGETWEGAMPVFEPLSNDFELQWADLQPVPGGRVLRLNREGGRTAATYRFEGDRLVSFEWQRGGLVATAIPVDEFQRWAAVMP